MNILFRRSFSSNNVKKIVTLVGSGGIGQPLALLCSMHDSIGEVRLISLENTLGIAKDISHIPRPTKVIGYPGDDEESIKSALTGSDIVVISAGIPRKPIMTRDDLFSVNASIVRNWALNVGKYCPSACFQIISNPINSTVPIAEKALESLGVFDQSRVFGITHLDVIRSQKLIGEFLNIDPRDISIPVVGGHAGKTILPLLSCIDTYKEFPEIVETDVERITHNIQFAGDEVVKAKEGNGSATLSMAYASFDFLDSYLNSFASNSDVRLCCYNKNNISPSPYFACEVAFKNGLISEYFTPNFNSYEKKNFTDMIDSLIQSVEKGYNYK